MSINKDLILGFVYCEKDKTFSLFRMPEDHPVGCKYNGFGGKIELDETNICAYVRESKEEVGLKVNYDDVEIIASVPLESDYFGSVTLYVGIHNVKRRKPAMKGGEFETKPVWVTVEDFPWNDLPPGNEAWLKPVLMGYSDNH